MEPPFVRRPFSTRAPHGSRHAPFAIWAIQIESTRIEYATDPIHHGRVILVFRVRQGSEKANFRTISVNARIAATLHAVRKL